MQKQSFSALVASANSCTLCIDELTNGVRPVFQVHPSARILIAGQAPGLRVHQSGIPFDDASGHRLREWMGIDYETFYDKTKVAILPMGFCYPGKGKSGDLAPKAVCAQTWRQKFLDKLPDIQLTLLIGKYAQVWHLSIPPDTLTETVQLWECYGEKIMPLPHPSSRNNIWLRKNSWFETSVLPILKSRVATAISV